jgi:polyisoprenoid-binding protein YceI
VVDGTGGVQKLTEEDRVDISKTIDDEVLEKAAIKFRSTGSEAHEGGDRLHVKGDLEIAGHSHPAEFDLDVSADGRITGIAVLQQTDFGMKPYSALFGALKVANEVEVVAEASLPSS